MIFRNMFKQIFNKNPTQGDIIREYQQFMTLNNSVNLLSAADAKNYQNLFVRICVDTIAENGAKLKPKVIRKVDGKPLPGKKNIQNLLDTAPNEYMNAFEFLYKVITLWANDNNVFIYIRRDSLTGEITGYYPINYADCEFLEAADTVFVRFRFMTGFTMVVPYDELAHLRRFFGPSDLFGEANDTTLTKQIGLLNTVNRGLAAAANSANYLRGILKMNLNMQDDDIKKAQDRFVNDYMNVNNNGGVAALDSRMEYQELKGNIVTAESDQMKLIRQDIMGYFHLNESILLAKYDENEWSAFYESVLEPIAIRLGLELTRKSFTQKELGFGNQIIFEANRLQYTSNTSKITLLKELLPMGLLTINEGREILNLAPVEGGEKRIISLNYVDADKANEYQLGRISKKADESKKEPEEDSNAEGGDAK
mgnify:CR=1 FL=1